MYKIFVNEKLIILTDNADIQLDETSKVMSLSDFSIKEIWEELLGKGTEKIYLFHSKKEKLLQKFCKKVKPIIAAGGIVKNEKGDTLFIKRKGKWDLPKGKLDKGEDLQTCALREVIEETGIKNLSITGFATITYHLFKRDGEIQLKQTYWYDMFSDFKGEFTPQTEEEITKVKWREKQKMRKTLENSYRNIVEIFSI